MNRFKKELRAHGVKLKCDYPCLPFGGIETVVVDSENATISAYYVGAGWVWVKVNRDFTFSNCKQVVYFFSEKQVEEYFIPRLECMLARECREYIRRWCEDHKAIVPGSGEYSYEKLCNLLIDPWNPVLCLDYLGF